MKTNPYSRRSAVEAQEKLASIRATRVADPALALVTVTGCEVSVDKSLVRAYIAAPKGREAEVEAALARGHGRLRALLGKSLGWRVTPELDLRLDTTADVAERLERALSDVPPSSTLPGPSASAPTPAPTATPWARCSRWRGSSTPTGSARRT